jgi:hypothetical protein
MLTYACLKAALEDLEIKHCSCSSVAQPSEKGPALVNGDRIVSKTSGPSELVATGHSMDTEWFAVDKVGRVAMFDSGEPGAVPKVFLSAHFSQYSYGEFFDSLITAPSGQSLLDLRDFFEAGPGKVFGMLKDGEPYSKPLAQRETSVDELRQAHRLLQRPSLFRRYKHLIDAVCWCRDEAGLKALGKDAKRLPVDGHTVAWVWSFPANRVFKLFEKGIILSILLEEYYPAPQRFGLYVYDNNDYDCGPYQRNALPANPIRVDDLPDSPRETCGHVVFREVDFDQAEKIQPAEFFECEAWSEIWVGVDGEPHRFERDASEEC